MTVTDKSNDRYQKKITVMALQIMHYFPILLEVYDKYCT